MREVDGLFGSDEGVGPLSYDDFMDDRGRLLLAFKRKNPPPAAFMDLGGLGRWATAGCMAVREGALLS